MSCKININKIKNTLTVECNFNTDFDEYVKKFCKEIFLSKTKSGRLHTYNFKLNQEIINYLDSCYDDIEIEEFGINGDLFSVIDKDDINNIYRLLAKKYHPDKGGSTEMMQFINGYFEKLR